MAHVFKPVYTKPIPAHAERVRHKDGPAVRWKGRGGKWVVALVCADKPTRCRVEAATWYVEYTDHDGRVRKKKGFADKGATEALMAELVRKAARICAGLLPPEAAQPRRGLSELIADWCEYVKAGGATPEHAARNRQQVGDVAAGIGAVRPADFTPAAVQGWLAKLRAANDHNGKRFGKGSSRHYLAAAKAFTRWLAVVDRSEPVDHLSAVQRKTDDTDVRKQRRPLPADQLERLVATARGSADTWYGLTGPERAALYSLASTTGFRAKELSSLWPASFDFAAHTVTITGGRAKNKKTVTLPLNLDVERDLLAMLAGRSDGPLWPHRGGATDAQAWYRNGARMIARDLAAAGIPVRDPAGKSYDFHALRGQFATDLDRAGVSLGRAQRLMRLSNPALLTKHYSRPDEAALAADVNRLRPPKPKG